MWSNIAISLAFYTGVGAFLAGVFWAAWEIWREPTPGSLMLTGIAIVAASIAAYAVKVMGDQA